MGILFALIAMVLWGFEELFLKEVIGRLKAFTTLFINTITGLVVILVVTIVFFADEITLITNTHLILAFLTAFLAFLGWVFFYKALERQELSLIASLDEAWIIIAILIGIFFLGETLGTFHILAVIAVLAGAFIISVDLSKLKHVRFISGSGYEALSILFVGISIPLEKVVITNIGEANSILYLELLFIPLLLLWMIVGQEKFIRPTKKLFKIAVASGIFDSISIIFFILALAYSDISVVAPIVASSVVVAIVLARIYLKEKMAPKEIFGAILILAGVLTLSIIS
jgi:uncharacterized membrane protein